MSEIDKKTNTEERLKHFFSVLRAKREAFAENYAYFAPQLAPQFNCFDFIDDYEPRLSEIIAALLNPQGTHAQGELFLKLFFDELEINYPTDTSKIEVRCEVRTDKITNSLRRMDILVSFGTSFGLMIENKPWANDQNQQLGDYAEQMKKTFVKNWCLVYLSGDDSDPDEKSATAVQIADWKNNNQYQKINFETIVEWLKKCEWQCQSDHVRHFLRDFISYCQQTFLGEIEMMDAELMQKVVKENLDLTLAIEVQMNAVKDKLLQEFLTELEKGLKGIEPSWTVTKDEGITYDSSLYKGIFFHNPKWTKYHLRLDFQQRQCRSLIFGICKTDEIHPNLSNDIRNTLNGEFGQGKSSKWWPWYFELGSGHPQFWLDVQSGDKVKKLIVLFKKLKEVAEPIINKSEGI